MCCDPSIQKASGLTVLCARFRQEFNYRHTGVTRRAARALFPYRVTANNRSYQWLGRRIVNRLFYHSVLQQGLIRPCLLYAPNINCLMHVWILEADPSLSVVSLRMLVHVIYDLQCLRRIRLMEQLQNTKPASSADQKCTLYPASHAYVL